MPQTLYNYSLKKLNTFGLDVKTKYYVSLNSEENTKKWISKYDFSIPVFILGGGSNVLFKHDFEGVVVHPQMDFIRLLDESDSHVFLEVGAGMNWDDFVSYCVQNDYYGIENLSAIPGNVGASPVQNIGAYGIEVKDVITHVRGFYLKNGESFRMENKDCQFDYRQSIFKAELKNQVIITSVGFKLSRQRIFQLNYGDVAEMVLRKGGETLDNVRSAIIDIRAKKLPDPLETGNAGSFFKNPFVSQGLYQDLKRQYVDLKGYEMADGRVKVPAGWLIDKAGWKGRTLGRAGVHPNQALVLINCGRATGEDILQLADKIQKDIKTKFDILLEKEVNVIG
jgi:UDP-N-acetylmuramate dehydrogenase